MPRLFKNITHSFSWLAFNSPLQILMNKSLLARIPHEISKPTAASIVSVTSAQAVKLVQAE